LATTKGRNWHRVKASLSSEIVQQFIKINQLASAAKEALQLQTPGQAGRLGTTAWIAAFLAA
jgi:hypothetical protein